MRAPRPGSAPRRSRVRTWLSLSTVLSSFDCCRPRTSAMSVRSTSPVRPVRAPPPSCRGGSDASPLSTSIRRTPFALEQLHLVDVAPDQRRALGHRHLGEKFRPGPPAAQASPPSRSGPAESVGRRNRGRVMPQATTIRPMGVISKMPKGSKTARARDTVHEKVGGGPDQRERATHDRGVTQRDQVFRRQALADDCARSARRPGSSRPRSACCS